MDPAGNLRSDIKQALERQELTTWQRNFLADIHSRLERSKGKVRLSEKQWAKVFEIIGRQDTPVDFPASKSSARSMQPQMRIPSPRFLRSRRRFFWRLQRLAFGFALVAIVAVVQLLVGAGPWQEAVSETIAPTVAQQFTITDGDTVHVVGEAKGTRLVGYNTPEKFAPQCESERQLGERASARLKELVTGGATRLTKIACACPPGTEGTDRCNHGRSCGTLLVDGKDVGDILIREGLAVPFGCAGTRCPAIPRPWCG
ncbi:thermonuclease family protein [Rhizobium sp. 768_B6_N1_8]|uniref:thermonuclease family protein n=1 Tax=unclassified Rhizobium TaxID=2613769 RepID=UPI003F1ECEB3